MTANPSPPSRRFLFARTFSSLALLLASLWLTACEPGSALPPLPEAAEQPYRLGVDEQIRIITFGQESLTGQFRVNDRGAVAIPLLGSIPASGLTTAELEHSIEARLRAKKVLLDPSVSVEVLGYRPIFILGEVAKPGQYAYQPNMTALTAIAVAGGFTYRAQTHYLSILRSRDGQPVEGRVTRTAVVHPGDVITVFERYF